MKKLITLDLSRLHHAEFGQFIVRFFEDFGSSTLNANTDSDFKRMSDAIQAQIPMFNSALDQVRASEESLKIADADAIRDADLQALRDAIKPYRNAKTQIERDAYTAIKLLLNEYKNVQYASFEEETNKLNMLVDQLLSSEYSFHVSVLSIVKFANHLSDSNTAFNTAFAKRSYETSQKQTYDVKALRRNLSHDYKQMANYIASLANVKSDTFYTDVLAILNNGRAYLSGIVLSRRNGNKKEINN
ncbi:hypothetical protein SAMN05421664_3789 [Chryseobacterium soldanellicola]|uniref:Uncharacterized protein n=1 Tax=Chryseobacterium soldanellicola TaxID=311333 RepID=A0A1H1GNL4_9FLAO|nr:DUF6261 family protein [Chryseobacterium soldanellicola]SDR14731.1 hypothetical protein SAMN05421664_3789 [Chryseobacterium soldanellicola]